MKLGQAKCKYCGQPLLSSAIVDIELHYKICPKNPDNWHKDTRWIELIKQSE